MFTVAWESFTGMQRRYFDTRDEAMQLFVELNSRGLNPYFYED